MAENQFLDCLRDLETGRLTLPGVILKPVQEALPGVLVLSDDQQPEVLRELRLEIGST